MIVIIQGVFKQAFGVCKCGRVLVGVVRKGDDGKVKCQSCKEAEYRKVAAIKASLN